LLFLQGWQQRQTKGAEKAGLVCVVWLWSIWNRTIVLIADVAMNAGIHSAPRVENAPMVLEQGTLKVLFFWVMILENVSLYSVSAVLVVMNTGMLCRMCKTLHGR
jgi:hypothetical protein